MRRRWLIAVLAAAAACPAPAAACSVLLPEQRSREQRVQEARDLIERAAAIIDGEVVRPFERGRQSALVRAVRVLKGPEQDYFEVAEESSCDHALERTGERMRLFLFGGPEVYHAVIEFAEPRVVDRLLGSDRRRDWPYFGGSPEDRRPLAD